MHTTAEAVLLAVLMMLPLCALTGPASAGGGKTPTDALPAWAMGPFVRLDKPVLSPTPNLTFRCPVSGRDVRWQSQNAFNPAPVVKDGKVHLLFRCDDESWWERGEHRMPTCRIGLAWSLDGRLFTCHPSPVLFPANDEFKRYEWPGGCEDVHIAEDGNGTYYLYYTTWNGQVDTMSVATSQDLLSWKKHGPVFAKLARDRVNGSRTGVVVTRLDKDGRLLPAKINGKFWMYYTHPSLLAESENLIDWKPTGRGVWTEARNANRPAAGSHESGAIALLRDDGILLMFNGQNWGGVAHPAGGWSLGQALIDRNDLLTVIEYMERPFLHAELAWEKEGYVPMTTVANGMVLFKREWLLYYGAADHCIGLAVHRGSPWR